MNYNKRQLTALVLLRVLVGWHVLYEGISKLVQPNWSAALYLDDSKGIFRGLFTEMSSSESVMQAVDMMNQWGLVLIGLALVAGAFVKIASWAGIALLTFYTMSHPSFIGAEYMMPVEGAYLWVDKNIVEIAALIVILVLPTSKQVGLDRFLQKYLGRFI